MYTNNCTNFFYQFSWQTMQIRGSRQSVKTRQNCIFDYKKLILGNWKTNAGIQTGFEITTNENKDYMIFTRTIKINGFPAAPLYSPLFLKD
jgi:hypothetical protein